MFLLQNNLKFQEQLYVWEDPLFSLKCSKKANKIIFVDGALYNYCRRENSKSHIVERNYILQWVEAASLILNEASNEEEYKIILMEFVINGYFSVRMCIKDKSDRAFSDLHMQRILDKRPDYHIERDLNKLYKDWYNRKMLAVTNLVRKKRSYQNV